MNPETTVGARTVADVKRTATRWIAENAPRWDGIAAAHFVGGITTMDEDAVFPAHKDVDMHLVFDDGSPMLTPPGPFLNAIETEYEGLLIEAGIKPVAEYASPEIVLANPEIAHHLTLDSVAYDPRGVIGDLQDRVRADYPHRRWIEARLDHERRGLSSAIEMLGVARAMLGASGEVNILGYSFTFVGAMLDVASLRAPTTGSQLTLRVRRTVRDHQREHLYEELLSMMGVDRLSPSHVEALLHEGADAFDLAVTVRNTPHPFGHKLNAHLRPYFVESCRTLLADGYYREAAYWLTPFYLSSTDVIAADAPDGVRAPFIEARERFLRDLGMASDVERASRLQWATQLHDEFTTLASRIADENPAAID